MALIKCPECGREVSDKAKSCIHCGYPLSEMHIIEGKSGINENISHNYEVSKKIDEALKIKGFSRVEALLTIAEKYSSSDAYNYIGMYYFGIKQYETAAQYFKKALELQEDELFHYNLGNSYQCLVKDGNYEYISDCLSELNKAPNNVDALYVLGQINFHDKYSMFNQDWDIAMKYYLQMVEKFPNHSLTASALNNTGYIFANKYSDNISAMYYCKLSLDIVEDEVVRNNFGVYKSRVEKQNGKIWVDFIYEVNCVKDIESVICKVERIINDSGNIFAEEELTIVDKIYHYEYFFAERFEQFLNEIRGRMDKMLIDRKKVSIVSPFSYYSIPNPKASTLYDLFSVQTRIAHLYAKYCSQDQGMNIHNDVVVEQSLLDYVDSIDNKYCNIYNKSAQENNEYYERICSLVQSGAFNNTPNIGVITTSSGVVLAKGLYDIAFQSAGEYKMLKQCEEIFLSTQDKIIASLNNMWKSDFASFVKEIEKYKDIYIKNNVGIVCDLNGIDRLKYFRYTRMPKYSEVNSNIYNKILEKENDFLNKRKEARNLISVKQNLLFEEMNSIKAGFFDYEAKQQKKNLNNKIDGMNRCLQYLNVKPIPKHVYMILGSSKDYGSYIRNNGLEEVFFEYSIEKGFYSVIKKTTGSIVATLNDNVNLKFGSARRIYGTMINSYDTVYLLFLKDASTIDFLMDSINNLKM